MWVSALLMHSPCGTPLSRGRVLVFAYKQFSEYTIGYRAEMVAAMKHLNKARYDEARALSQKEFDIINYMAAVLPKETVAHLHALRLAANLVHDKAYESWCAGDMKFIGTLRAADAACDALGLRKPTFQVLLNKWKRRAEKK